MTDQDVACELSVLGAADGGGIGAVNAGPSSVCNKMGVVKLDSALLWRSCRGSRRGCSPSLPNDGECGAHCASPLIGDTGTGTSCGVLLGIGIALGDLDSVCGEASCLDPCRGVVFPNNKSMSAPGGS